MCIYIYILYIYISFTYLLHSLQGQPCGIHFLFFNLKLWSESSFIPFDTRSQIFGPR